MIQEEKQELLVALCGYLPYGIQYKDAHGYKKTLDIWSHEFHTALNTILYDGKPSLYLRPMSSMTEEEDLEFIGIGLSVVNYGTNGNAKHKCKLSIPEIDWLNANHFDYRGLIEKGLALEAPEEMYKV